MVESEEGEKERSQEKVSLACMLSLLWVVGCGWDKKQSMCASVCPLRRREEWKNKLFRT